MPFASSLGGPNLIATIGADTSGLTSGLALAETAVRNFGAVLTSINPLVVGLATGAAALGLAFGASVDQAAKFDAMLINIQNNTTMTTADVGLMRESILKLASDTGSSFDALGQGFMHIVNLTGDTAHAMDILKVATESAVSTGGDAAKTAEVLAQTMHQYGLDVSTASTATAQHSDIMANATQVQGVFHLAAAESNQTLEQFANSSGRAIGVAANLGVSIEDVAGALATLTKNGMNSAQAQTQVINIMERIANPTAAARKEIEALSKASGVDLVSDFTASGEATKGLSGIINDLRTAYKNTGMDQAAATEETMKLIGAQRGGLGMAILLGNGYKDFTQITGDLNDKTKIASVTQDAYNRTQETAAFQWNLIKERVDVAAVSLHTTFLPALTSVLKAVADGIPTMVGAINTGMSHISTAIQQTTTQVNDFKKALDSIDQSKLSQWLGSKVDSAMQFGADQGREVGKLIGSVAPTAPNTAAADAAMDHYGHTTDTVTASTNALAAADTAAAAAAQAHKDALQGLTQVSNGALQAQNAQELVVLQATADVKQQKDALKEAETAVKSMQRAIDEATATIKPFADAVTTSADHLKAMESALRTATDALQPLANAARDSGYALQDAQHNLDVATRALDPFQKAVTVANDAVKDYEKVIAAAKQTLVPFQQAVKDANDAVKDYEKVIAAAKETLKPYELAVKDAQDAIKQQETAIRDAQAALQPYKDAVTESQRALSDLTDKTNEAKSAFDGIKTSISDAKHELDGWRNAPIAGQGAFEKKLQDLDMASTKLKINLDDLKIANAPKDQIKALEDQIKALAEQADKVKLTEHLQIDGAREKIKDFGKDLKEFSPEQILANMQKAQDGIDGLTKKLGPAQQAWQNDQKAQDAAKDALLTSQKALQDQTDALQPLNDQLGFLKDHLAFVQTNLDTASKILVPMNAHLDDLKTKVGLANENLDQASKVLIPMNAHLDDLKTKAGLASDALEIEKGKLIPLNDLVVAAARHHADLAYQYDVGKRSLDPYIESVRLANIQHDKAVELYDAENKKIDPLRGLLADLTKARNLASDAVQIANEKLDAENLKLIDLKTNYEYATKAINDFKDAQTALATAPSGLAGGTQLNPNNSAFPTGGVDPGSIMAGSGTAATINAILQGTGLAGLGDKIVAAALAHNVPVELALAMFRKEANFAAPGSLAAQNNNPGNLRAAGGINGESGIGEGGFAKFETMAKGIEGYMSLLDRSYRAFLDHNNIAGLINTYAPPSENNSAQYAQQIQQWMKDYQQQMGMGGGTGGFKGAMAALGLAGAPITTEYSSAHEGIDIAGPEGTAIHALQGGTVVLSEFSSRFGNMIEVANKTTGALEEYYGHLASRLVQVGAQVNAGDIIGTEGHTGSEATGPHVHFQMYDEQGAITDPRARIAELFGTGHGPNDPVGGSALDAPQQARATVPNPQNDRGTAPLDAAQQARAAVGAATSAAADASAAKDATAKGAQDAATVAQQAAQMAQLIQLAVGSLTKLSEYVSGANFGPAVKAFAADLTTALTSIETVANKFQGDGIKNAGAFASGAGQMLTIIGSGVTAMLKLKDYQGLAPGVLDMFGADMVLVTKKLLDIAGQFKADALKNADEFTAAAQKMMTILGTGVQAMAALQGYQGIAPNLLDWFGADIRLVIRKLLDVADHMNKDGIDSANKVLTSAYKVLAPITAVVSTMQSLASYQGVAPNLLDWFGADIRLVVVKLADVAYHLDSDGAPAVVLFNKAIGGIVSAVATSLQLIGSVSAYQGIAPGVIDKIGGDFRSIVTMTAGMEKDGATARDQVLHWKDEVDAMAKAYREAIDTIKSLPAMAHLPGMPTITSGGSSPTPPPVTPAPPPTTAPPPLPPTAPGPVVPGGIGARGQERAPGGVVVNVHLPNVTSIGNQQDIQTLAYQVGQELQRRK